MVQSLCADGYIECTSLSFSYDIMGRVTVSYTTFHQSEDFCYTTSLEAGGRQFEGTVTQMTLNKIQGTLDWYETHVSLIATAT